MRIVKVFLPMLLMYVAVSTVSATDWSGYLDKLKGSVNIPTETSSVASLSHTEMVAGLKEALSEGTQFAVDSLGKEGGFLDNSKVKIPMPDSLSWVEKSLRTLHQDELADEFIDTMNHAAERAVPEAAVIFGTAIRNMSIEDAQEILTGPDDAATQYFRTSTQAELTERMRPVVEEATAQTGVTSAYKNMTARAGGMISLLPSDATDLDGYVTSKTLDGLFIMIAEEEKKIRENPLARSTDLLKKVFGAYQ